MNEDDRREPLRSLTAGAASGKGRLPEHGTSHIPVAGDLYVLPQTANFPVEWALLEPTPDRPDLWLAVPADTNPMRGSADVAVATNEPSGPLWLRGRFCARLHTAALAQGRRTGAVSAEVIARMLATWRGLEGGDLEEDPLAAEIAADPEYQEWERTVLEPARTTVVAATPTEERAVPTAVWRPRSLLALAAALGFLAVGFGAWNWHLVRTIDRLSAPMLLGGSQEIVVGTDVRAPVVLELAPTDQRLLVFLVLSGQTAQYRRYRVELTGADERVLWRSPDVERGPLPELNLVIPRRFLDPARTPFVLRLFALEDDHTRHLADVPLTAERAAAGSETVYLSQDPSAPFFRVDR